MSIVDTSAENRVPRFEETFEDSVVYADGWARLRFDAELIEAFWVDGFDPAIEMEDAAGRGRGPEKRVSPIWEYSRSSELRAVQWINVTHDRAAVLIADNDWHFDGDFHLWVSPGAGRKPYEVNPGWYAKIVKGDCAESCRVANTLTALAEQYLGLRRL